MMRMTMMMMKATMVAIEGDGGEEGAMAVGADGFVRRKGVWWRIPRGE